MSEIPHPRATARGVPVRVVAAVTEKGVVRGIAHFTSWKEIELEVEKAVGVLVEAQWSSNEYLIPAYLDGVTGFAGWDVPSGVYIFRWLERTTDWRDPEKRYESRDGELLWRPRGWSTGHPLVRVEGES